MNEELVMESIGMWKYVWSEMHLMSADGLLLGFFDLLNRQRYRHESACWWTFTVYQTGIHHT
jgi:hypothetical protein